MSKAIFLGTFNPPHKGHIDAIKSVIEWHLKNHKIDLKQIYIIPCWQNPNKEFVTSYWDRYHMCLNEFSSLCDWCVLDNIEEELKPKYTYELLDYFHSNNDMFIKDDFWWIITEETMKELVDGKWKESERLLKENKFILLMENDLPDPWFIKANIPNENLVLVPMVHDRDLSIHSTAIRKYYKEGKTGNPYVNESVDRYIIENKLY